MGWMHKTGQKVPWQSSAMHMGCPEEKGRVFTVDFPKISCHEKASFGSLGDLIDGLYRSWWQECFFRKSWFDISGRLAGFFSLLAPGLNLRLERRSYTVTRATIFTCLS